MQSVMFSRFLQERWLIINSDPQAFEIVTGVVAKLDSTFDSPPFSSLRLPSGTRGQRCPFLLELFHHILVLSGTQCKPLSTSFRFPLGSTPSASIRIYDFSTRIWRPWWQTETSQLCSSYSSAWGRWYWGQIGSDGQHRSALIWPEALWN